MAFTSFARTVDALLRSDHDTTLADFLSSRHEAGRSFAETAAELNDLTGGTVQVTRTTIANWTADIERAA